MRINVEISFLGVICCTLVSFAAANQWCSQEDGTAHVCLDTYYKVGYCCDFEDGYYRHCCLYDKVWALWYFWTGIFLFLCVVGACVGCIMKMRNRNHGDEASQNSEVEQVVFVTQQQPPPPTQVMQVVDAPPSYQQVEAQTVDSQQTEYAKYGTSVDKAPLQ